MQETLELNPEIAAKIISNAAAKNLSVEIYLKQIINANQEDKRLEAIREAVNDDLFLADLHETAEDFRHVDFEQ